MFLQSPIQSKTEIVETRRHGGRHYVTPAGTFPSVTTVLSMSDHSYLDEWRNRIGHEEADRITKRAAARGTLLHSTVEQYLKNDPDYQVMNLVTLELFRQIQKPLDEMIETVYTQEIPLYSKVLRTAGRCDCIALIGGKVHIVDFKTSTKEKDPTFLDNYHCQVSAYGIMSNEILGTEIRDYVIVIANLEENFPSLVFGKIKDHIGDFVSLRKKYDEFILPTE